MVEESGSVETEVTGIVVALPAILVLATVVAPEADSRVSRLVEVAAIAVLVAVRVVVADEAAVIVSVTYVGPACKVVE